MKKFFVFSVAMLMLLGLAACGGAGGDMPSAEELLSGNHIADEASAELSIQMAIDVALTQEELGISDEDAGDMMWPVLMTVSADITAVNTETASHTSGDLAVSFLETEQTMTLDNWTAHLGDGTCRSYDYNAYDGVWVRYEGPEFEGLTGNAEALSISADSLENAEVKQDGKDYVLTGRLPVSALAGDSILSFGESISGGVLPEDSAFDVQMGFDGETRNLKSLTLALAKDTAPDTGMTACSVTANVVRTGFEPVEVPSEVEANAVDGADADMTVPVD